MAENRGNLITLPYDDNKRESVFCCERILSESYPVHAHNFFEIEFLIEGEGVQVINGKAHPWKKGDICFFFPSDFHEIRVDKEIRFYNISFDIKALSEETVGHLMDLRANVFSSSEGSVSHFEKLSSMLADATVQSEIFKEPYAVLLLNAFLSHLHSLAERQRQIKAQLPAVKQAALFMHARFAKKLTLAEIASAVYLSPAYLSELFSKEMKMTVFRYLAELRIDYAKKLLDSTADSITEICFSCGYTSIPNFMKDFKRITGLSPLKYRARNKKAP